ncbi:MAG TPA: hypothetical protein VFZ27_07795 [Terriglobia bacterium]|nr:hypothetical protein [Terriglobia bacterium]
MTSSVRQKEIVRGKILYYLKLIYPQPATLPLLQGELDIFGYPVPIDDLDFHVAYLAEKGLVNVDNVRGPVPSGTGRGPHARRYITLVKITAKGIDYFDGRLPKDEGVYLEPEG